MRTVVKVTILVFLAIILGLPMAFASDPTDKVIGIQGDSPQTAAKLAYQWDLDIWHVGNGEIRARAAARDILRLRAAGYTVHIYFNSLTEYSAYLKTLESPILRAGDFTNYHNLAAANQMMLDLATAHPDICARYDIGNTIQGRDIFALKISDNVATTEDESRILFTGCTHAREWISVEVPLYLADYILSNYGTDPQVTRWVNEMEIWIVPIVNPDGYLYTWTNDRYWRKNRRYNANRSYGVDINRNYGYMWGLSSGSSGTQSSETYRGTAAFSEPETQAIRDLSIDKNFITAITYHSYGEDYLYPWGYTYDLAPDNDLMNWLGQNMASLTNAVHGEHYVAAAGGSGLYLTSGDYTDWAYGVYNTFAYTDELRGTDFVLAKQYIIPTCEESLAGAAFLLDWTLEAFCKPPADFINPGWNWISFPLAPPNADPASIFGLANVENKLYWWDPVVKTITFYPADFTTVAPKLGYTLFSPAATLNPPGYRSVPTTTAQTINVPEAGWFWIGQPHNHTTLLSSLSVKNLTTGVTRTAIQDANATDPWINWNWLYWDSNLDTALILSFSGADDDTLRPWYGYRLWANERNLQVTIPAG